MPDSTSRLAFAAAAALYLGLAVASGVVWEWEHDEGVSFSQAFGLPKIPGQPEPSRPILETYQRINGQTERRAADVMDALRVGGGMHPPAYYLLLHHWGGWFGTQRLVLRLPIYLAGILSLLAARSMTRRLVNPRAGTWAMFLLASSPWFIGFSNLARPYAMIASRRSLAVPASVRHGGGASMRSSPSGVVSSMRKGRSSP